MLRLLLTLALAQVCGCVRRGTAGGGAVLVPAGTTTRLSCPVPPPPRTWLFCLWSGPAGDLQCGVQWRGGAGEPSVCRADPALELLPSQTSCQIQFTAGLSHHGRWVCLLHDNLTLSATRYEVEVRVGVEAAVELSLPGGPVTARQGVLTLRPGREVQLVCSAQAGFPAPLVEFSGPAGLAVTTAAARPADSVGHTWPVDTNSSLGCTVTQAEGGRLLYTRTFLYRLAVPAAAAGAAVGPVLLPALLARPGSLALAIAAAATLLLCLLAGVARLARPPRPTKPGPEPGPGVEAGLAVPLLEGEQGEGTPRWASQLAPSRQSVPAPLLIAQPSLTKNLKSFTSPSLRSLTASQFSVTSSTTDLRRSISPPGPGALVFPGTAPAPPPRPPRHSKSLGHLPRQPGPVTRRRRRQRSGPAAAHSAHSLFQCEEGCFASPQERRKSSQFVTITTGPLVL